jgi:hypothetical protein
LFDDPAPILESALVTVNRHSSMLLTTACALCCATSHVLEAAATV